MHNDSKLGLLAGVGGVVVAAVLLLQKPVATVPAESAKNVVAPVVQTPTVPVKLPAPSTPVATRNRAELEAKTTSRPARNDDDE